MKLLPPNTRILSKEEQREISEATIKRFEDYVKEQIKQSEEEQMEQNKNEKINEETEMIKTAEETKENPFNNIGGDYVKLERDKAKILGLINWNVAKVKKFKDDHGNLKEQMEFSAEVLIEDGQPVKKIFSTTSFNALKGLKDVFSKYWPNSGRLVMIRIKKIGEGKSTVYDIEEIKK